MWFLSKKRTPKFSIRESLRLSKRKVSQEYKLHEICSDDLFAGPGFVESSDARARNSDASQTIEQPRDADIEEELEEECDEPEDEVEQFIDDVEDEFDQSEEPPEEEEIDLEDEMEKFEANLQQFHPHLRNMWRNFDEEEIMAQVYERRNPLISFNSSLMISKPAVATKGASSIPHIIGVTGHAQAGGNLGLNGIYEVRSGLFNDRPVYQKTLEKRLVRDLMTCPAEGLIADRMPLRTWDERILTQRSSRVRKLGKPVQEAGLATMWPTPNAWFLYFDKNLGCWCIGPKVGHYEVYAMCPGAEEFYPDKLDRWQVWNCGEKLWYSHKSLRTFKGCR